jgi:hypothetical protein
MLDSSFPLYKWFIAMTNLYVSKKQNIDSETPQEVKNKDPLWNHVTIQIHCFGILQASLRTPYRLL